MIDTDFDRIVATHDARAEWYRREVARVTYPGDTRSPRVVAKAPATEVVATNIDRLRPTFILHETPSRPGRE